MNRWLIAPTVFIVLIGATLAGAQETIKDRKGFIPNRKQVPLKGIEIGILLTEGQPILSTEGRSGPADQLVFSTGGNSYRWVYVQTQDNPPTITNLQVPVGEKGEKAVYPSLHMATPRSVQGWDVKRPYALIEVGVNDGRGSPAIDSFVATTFRPLDGTKEYPLKVADVVQQLKDRYAAHLAKEQNAIDKAMKDASEKSLAGKALTGPREKKDLMYLTWLPDSKTMRVCFKTTITDGAYTVVKQPIGPRNPPPLKLPPKKAALLGVDGDTHFVVRIAPQNFALKTGTTIRIELGLAYVVDKKGDVVHTETLPIESSSEQINTRVFQPGPIGPRPVPLPLPPVKK